jgi:LuxR family quorum-sensing transcriptional regulator LasR
MASLDKLLALFDCETEQKWSAALFEIARSSGFDNVLYGVVPNKMTPFETAFLKSNYPDAWRITYDRSKLHYVDPVVSHCLVSTLPVAWTSRNFKGHAQQEFYEQACGYGLRSGITYPVHGALGEFGMLSFVASDNNHAAYDGQADALAQLSLIRDYALESSIRFVHKSATAAAEATRKAQTRLTPRELECVRWVMAGKSSWEISQILRCSEATINFHVSNLKKKFNVQTRQQAVVKAIKEQLIVPA